MTAFQKTSDRASLFLVRIFMFIATHPFESLFGLVMVLFFGWYLLALAGIFYPIFTIPFTLLVSIGAPYLLSKKPAFCHLTTLILAAFLLCIIILALSTHPIELVAEGRDQGTFINNALLLNQYHGFSFAIPEAKPFFAVYGEGKALNFPGLAYTATGTLMPEFPLGYSIWLAGFVSIFGLLGFSIANALLYFLSGMLFYALLKRVVPLFWSFLGTLVAMGGFLPVWFLSFTLSENLALFLFLLTTECVLRFQISKDTATLFLGLTSALALALTRIEGWAILALVFFIVTFQKSKVQWAKTYFFQKSLLGVLWIITALIISVWTLFFNVPYYKAILKALKKTTDQNLAVQNLGQETFPLYHVLWEYGIFLILIFGLVSCVYLWKTRRVALLIPFFLALPTLPYLLLPHITLDAPWMLRRFLFSLYPALFISVLWTTSLLIQRLQLKRSTLIWTILFTLLIGMQVPALRRFTETQYQTTLLPQVQKVADQVSPHDLLLVDREVTGDNFMMPPRILSVIFHRPAVYFFNPADLAKIDTSAYERVFLLVPNEKISHYETAFNTSLISFSDFTFVNDHSFRSSSPQKNTLPQKEIIRTSVSLVELP